MYQINICSFEDLQTSASQCGEKGFHKNNEDVLALDAQNQKVSIIHLFPI